MFNYGEIDKTPTVAQIRSIIEYMEKDLNEAYDFFHMMSMKRPKPNKILIDLNDAHQGRIYEILFDDSKIISFKLIEAWRS